MVEVERRGEGGRENHPCSIDLVSEGVRECVNARACVRVQACVRVWGTDLGGMRASKLDGAAARIPLHLAPQPDTVSRQVGTRTPLLLGPLLLPSRLDAFAPAGVRVRG
jgi:hypothetical protein